MRLHAVRHAQRAGAVLPEPTVEGDETLAVVEGWNELSTYPIVPPTEQKITAATTLAITVAERLLS
jgi:hypothetical protein